MVTLHCLHRSDLRLNPSWNLPLVNIEIWNGKWNYLFGSATRPFRRISENTVQMLSFTAPTCWQCVMHAVNANYKQHIVVQLLMLQSKSLFVGEDAEQAWHNSHLYRINFFLQCSHQSSDRQHRSEVATLATMADWAPT